MTNNTIKVEKQNKEPNVGRGMKQVILTFLFLNQATILFAESNLPNPGEILQNGRILHSEVKDLNGVEKIEFFIAFEKRTYNCSYSKVISRGYEGVFCYKVGRLETAEQNNWYPRKSDENWVEEDRPK